MRNIDTDALLRTDFKTRIEALARGVQTGIFSPNEARRREGLPAVANGDEPRVQQQQVGLSWGGFDFQPPAPQAPRAFAEWRRSRRQDGAGCMSYTVTLVDRDTLPVALLDLAKVSLQDRLLRTTISTITEYLRWAISYFEQTSGWRIFGSTVAWLPVQGSQAASRYQCPWSRCRPSR